MGGKIRDFKKGEEKSGEKKRRKWKKEGHTYFKHIKIALFRFSDILPKPDVQQNFASELSQNLVRTWSELGNAAEHSRTYHALS